VVGSALGQNLLTSGLEVQTAFSLHSLTGGGFAFVFGFFLSPWGFLSEHLLLLLPQTKAINVILKKHFCALFSFRTPVYPLEVWRWLVCSF
jgi:hypothetical protein